mgnify:FL=1
MQQQEQQQDQVYLLNYSVELDKVYDHLFVVEMDRLLLYVDQIVKERDLRFEMDRHRHFQVEDLLEMLEHLVVFCLLLLVLTVQIEDEVAINKKQNL